MKPANGGMPQVILIARKPDDGGIVLRDAHEYLEHPGYPRAVIVGKPSTGGGPAHFFANRQMFEKVGQSPPTQERWLPQIVYRLYAETPSVVMGMPKQEKNGDMGVECRALAFGRAHQAKVGGTADLRTSLLKTGSAFRRDASRDPDPTSLARGCRAQRRPWPRPA